MMYVSQIIRLNSLNVYSAVCQLYFSKTGGKQNNYSTKKKKKNSGPEETPELREGVGKTMREQGLTPTRVPHSWGRVAI